MRTRRIAFVSVLAACAVAIPAAPAMAGGDVTVMTRNIYLGADIIQLDHGQTFLQQRLRYRTKWHSFKR